MATSSGSEGSLEAPLSPLAARLGQPPYQLHEAVFRGDAEAVKGLLEEDKSVVNITDCHGNTPLHLAVMLGNEDIVKLLLSHNASARSKNSYGWTPLNESVSYGSRIIISSLLKRVHDEIKIGLLERKMQLLQSLRNLDDFYAELKWEFYTWVPLLSRLLPSDICRIYKTDTAIRLDSTIGDFTEMQWSRGDISFIYNGETAEGLSVVALDNKKKLYQRLSLNNNNESVEGEVEDHVDMLMARPIVYANMSTQPITVTRAQSGFLFFKSDRTDTVGEYTADVYNITDLILISRKRREHLSPEQIKRFEELSKRVESGDITKELEKEMNEEENSTEDSESSETKEHCPSLPPPPPSSTTWDQYLSSSTSPCLGRKMDLRVDRKSFRSTVYMCKECPIEMKKLLDILEVIAPYKHFHKLRQFVNLKLPPGFPVKLEIPVFPTVTAIITLQSYKPSQFPPSHFLIPRNYSEKIMRKVIFVEKKWIEERFIQPLQQLQRKRIAGPQYGLGPPPQQKK